ncbi:MAG: nuclear transport factor 2 family protein [bacterium]
MPVDRTAVPGRYMAAINAQSLDALRELCAEHVVLHHPMGVFEGRDLVLGFYENAVFRAKTHLAADGPVLVGGSTVAQQMLGTFPADNGFGMPIPDQRAMDLFDCDSAGQVVAITIYYLSVPSR